MKILLLVLVTLLSFLPAHAQDPLQKYLDRAFELAERKKTLPQAVKRYQHLAHEHPNTNQGIVASGYLSQLYRVELKNIKLAVYWGTLHLEATKRNRIKPSIDFRLIQFSHLPFQNARFLSEYYTQRLAFDSALKYAVYADSVFGLVSFGCDYGDAEARTRAALSRASLYLKTGFPAQAQAILIRTCMARIRFSIDRTNLTTYIRQSGEVDRILRAYHPSVLQSEIDAALSNMQVRVHTQGKNPYTYYEYGIYFRGQWVALGLESKNHLQDTIRKRVIQNDLYQRIKNLRYS